MKMNEAIEVLEKFKDWVYLPLYSDPNSVKEAIDTVVSFCEERMQNDKVDFLKSAKQPNQITHPYDLSK